MPSKKPVFFLAFANSGGNLKHLKKESKTLRDILLPLEDSERIRLIRESQADNEDVPEFYTRYEDQISVFHYGGHANKESLSFEDGAGYYIGLADLFKLQKNLKLVFLNACSTHFQALRYLEAGVPIVLLTNKDISDEHAYNFAKWFYKNLAKSYTIRRSYEIAVDQLKFQNRIDQSEKKILVIKRGVELEEKNIEEIPWRLYVREDRQSELEWKIPPPFDPKFLSRNSRPPISQKEIIGRKKEVDRINEIMEQEGQLLLIHGMAGVGKTVLAGYYLENHKNQYKHIAWVDYIGDLKGDLVGQIINTDALKVNFNEKDTIDKKYDELIAAMHNLEGPNILILDNISTESDADNLREFIRELPDRWNILVTSRIEIEGFQSLSIEVLPLADSIRLFTKYYQLKPGEKKDDLEKLLEQIGRHTLVTDLLARTLRGQRKITSPF